MTRIVAGLEALKKKAFPDVRESRLISCSAQFALGSGRIYSFAPLVSQSIVLKKVQIAMISDDLVTPAMVNFRIRRCETEVNSLAQADAGEEVVPVYLAGNLWDWSCVGLADKYSWDMNIIYKGIPSTFGFTAATNIVGWVYLFASFEVEPI